MTVHDYQQILHAYEDAISGLYAVSPGNLVQRDSTAEIAPAPDLDTRAQIVLDRSRDLSLALATRRSSEAEELRELADLQLLAAAALDLQVASDLVRLAEDGVPDAVRERGAGLPEAYRELQAILAIDPDSDITGLLGTSSERSATSTDPQAARNTLKREVQAALEDLRDAAADVVQKAFLGLTNLPLPTMQQAFGALFAEVTSRVSEGVATIVQKAITLVAQAIDKLLEAMGRDVEDAMRAQLGEWIEDLRTGTLFATMLDRIVETERLRDEVLGQIDKAELLQISCYGAAGKRIAELNVRFGKQKELITWVLKGLIWARPWLMPLVPWGPVGLSTAYVVAIGYSIYAFADRVDAYRLGGPERLDHLPGIRQIVVQELGAVRVSP